MTTAPRSVRAAPALGRFALACVALIVGATCASGHLLSIGSLSPENLFSADFYSHASQLHAAAVTVAMLVVLIGFAAPTAADASRSSRTLRTLATVSALASISALLVLASPGLSQPLLNRCVAVVQLLVGVCVLQAVSRLRRGRTWTPMATGLVAAALTTLAATAAALYFNTLPLLRHTWELALVVALASLAEPGVHDGEPVSRLQLIPVLGLVASTLRLGAPASVHDPLLVVRVVAGVVVAFLATRGLARRVNAPLAKSASRIAVIVFVEALALRSWLEASTEPGFIGDTLFATGIAHLEAFTVVFALLAWWLRDRAPAPRRGRVARVALLVAGAGVQVMCWAFVVLGTRGMPRNYMKYVVPLQDGHVWLAFGATMLVLGLGVTLLATRGARLVAPTVDEVFT